MPAARGRAAPECASRSHRSGLFDVVAAGRAQPAMFELKKRERRPWVPPRSPVKAPPRCQSRYRPPAPRAETGSRAISLRAQQDRRPRRMPEDRRSAPAPGLGPSQRGGQGGPPRWVIRPPAPLHAPHEAEDFRPQFHVRLEEGVPVPLALGDERFPAGPPHRAPGGADHGLVQRPPQG